MNGFFLAFLLLTIVALLVLVRWAAEDAIQRGKSPARFLGGRFFLSVGFICLARLSTGTAQSAAFPA
jgi:hypothetical protein